MTLWTSSADFKGFDFESSTLWIVDKCKLSFIIAGQISV